MAMGKGRTKISSDELSVKQKFYLGVLIKSFGYEDRTLSSPIILSSMKTEQMMSVNSIWWKQIVFELVKSSIIVEEKSDSRDIYKLKFNINIESVVDIELLYEELLSPKITEQNIDEMILLVNDDLNHHGIQMLREAFLYSQIRNIYPRYLIDSRINKEISEWEKRVKEFIIIISKIISEPIQVEKRINSEFSLEHIKAILRSKYDEMFKIYDEFRSIIGFSDPIAYNSYTEFACEMIGKHYDRTDTRNLRELFSKDDDWDKLD